MAATTPTSSLLAILALTDTTTATDGARVNSLNVRLPGLRGTRVNVALYSLLWLDYNLKI